MFLFDLLFSEVLKTEKKSAVPVPAALPSLSLVGGKTEFPDTATRQPQVSDRVYYTYVQAPLIYSSIPSKMVTLKKDPSKNPKKWVQAAEFVPVYLSNGL